MIVINLLVVISIGVVGASIILGIVLLLDSFCDVGKREKRRLKRIEKKLPPCCCGCQPKFVVWKSDFCNAKSYKLYCDKCITGTRYLDAPELAIKDWEHLLELHVGDNVELDKDYANLDATGVIVQKNYGCFSVKIKSEEFQLPYYALTKLKASAKVV